MTNLPPMAMLTLAAMAVGSLYHDRSPRIAATMRVPAVGSRTARRMWERCAHRLRYRPSSPAPTCAPCRSPAPPERLEARAAEDVLRHPLVVLEATGLSERLSPHRLAANASLETGRATPR